MSAHYPFDREALEHNQKIRNYTVLGLWIAILSLVVAAVPVTLVLLDEDPQAPPVEPLSSSSPAPIVWEFELSQPGVVLGFDRDACGSPFWIDFDQPFDDYYESGTAADSVQVPANADFLVGGCGDDARAYPAPTVTAGEGGTKRTETADGCAKVAAETSSPEWRLFADPPPQPGVVQCIITTEGTRLARVTFTGFDDGNPCFDFATWTQRE